MLGQLFAILYPLTFSTRRRLLSSVFLLILSHSTTSMAAWHSENVMGVAECGECHEDEVKVWKKTKHQKNFKKLSKNKDAKTIAKKMGIKRIKKPNTLCASCHYTVGHKSGKPRIVAGVSCESCHSPSKNWLETHNDFGGRGIKKKQEKPAHKNKRLTQLDKAGMIRPDNIYGWAKNCLKCHIVANEKLVNVGGHEAGSDFKLSKRSQSKIRHYPKASIDELRFLNLVSYSAELELSMKALAKAGNGKYAKAMIKRAKTALDKLKAANDNTPSTYAKQSIKLASKSYFKAGNSRLITTANNIAVNTMRMVQKKNGYPYPASQLKATKNTPAVSTQKNAKKSAPAKIKHKTKSKAKTYPKASSKPKPRPVPVKQKQKIKPTTSPTPVVDVINEPLPSLTKSPPKAAATTNSNDALLKSFELMTPLNEGLCQTYTPWALGSRLLHNNARISNNGCISIKVEAGKSSRLYLYTETINGEVTQLMPNTCNAMNMGFNILLPNTVEYFPKNERLLQDIIPLTKLPQVYRFYAVITDGTQADNQLARLSGQINSICDQAGNHKKTGTNFNNSLNLIEKQTSGHMQWKMRSIQP